MAFISTQNIWREGKELTHALFRPRSTEWEPARQAEGDLVHDVHKVGEHPGLLWLRARVRRGTEERGRVGLPQLGQLLPGGT